MNDEMYNLLARHFSGQATADEEIAVKDWVAENEQNKLSYAELSRMWLQTGEPEVIYFDTEAAWKKVAATISPAEEKTKVVRMFNWKKAVSIAAVIIALAGIWWIFNNKTNDLHVVADIDGQQIAFEDGSRVYLRKGSRIDYPKHFTTDKREVTLTGEGFFDITKDAAKPFTVSASQTEVKVLGTSFLVNGSDQKVEVVLKTGRVQFTSIANPKETTEMLPGDKAVFINGRIVKEKNSDENFDAWQTKQINFTDTPLRDVLTTLNNYYGVSIRLKKEEQDKLAEQKVTIKFNNLPLAQALSELELITSSHIRKVNENEYEVSSQ